MAVNIFESNDNHSRLRIRSGDSSLAQLEFADQSDADAGEIRYDHANERMTIHVGNNAERLRIDSDGDTTISTSATTMLPGATLNVISDKNVETDYDNKENYHLVLANPNNDTGEAIGMAFGITDTTTRVGAAIIHERDAAGSQGSLKFFTRPNNAGPPVELSLIHI